MKRGLGINRVRSRPLSTGCTDQKLDPYRALRAFTSFDGRVAYRSEISRSAEDAPRVRRRKPFAI